MPELPLIPLSSDEIIKLITNLHNRVADHYRSMCLVYDKEDYRSRFFRHAFSSIQPQLFVHGAVHMTAQTPGLKLIDIAGLGGPSEEMVLAERALSANIIIQTKLSLLNGLHFSLDNYIRVILEHIFPSHRTSLSFTANYQFLLDQLFEEEQTSITNRWELLTAVRNAQHNATVHIRNDIEFDFEGRKISLAKGKNVLIYFKDTIALITSIYDDVARINTLNKISSHEEFIQDIAHENRK